MKAPEDVDEKYLVLMADIFPTGWFAANNAFKGCTPEQISEQTVVLIGCGPVGLCALINALEYKPKHLLAVDSVPSRLQLARSLGAEPWNFKENRAGLDKRVQELTDGRGADAVIEVVGLSPALRTAFDLLRPWGTISSVGVHNAEVSVLFFVCLPFFWIGCLSWSAFATNKLLCPWILILTGSIADPLEWKRSLRQKSENPDGPLPGEIRFTTGIGGSEEESAPAWVCFSFPDRTRVASSVAKWNSFMAEKIMPLSQAVEAYDLFNAMKVQKVIFEADR